MLIEVLGAEFDGVLGCDYFSAYRRYHRECGVVLQFCLAHLIRDVKFLTTLPDARDRAYGEGLREALRGSSGDPPAGGMDGAGIPDPAGGGAGRGVAGGTQDVPATRASGNLAKRLESHGDSYFRFITTPGLEPTNNLAEQAIRFVVIDRRITQGTRGERGDRWCERIWTVMATCSQQGRSVFDVSGGERWRRGSMAKRRRRCCRERAEAGRARRSAESSGARSDEDREV